MKTVGDRLNTDMIHRDTELPGFGIRRHKGIALFSAAENPRARWLTIGPQAARWRAETAREEAVHLMGEIAGGTNSAEERRALKANPTVTQRTLLCEPTSAPSTSSESKCPCKPTTSWCSSTH